MLRVRNLSFAYNKTPVLENISVEISEGQIVAIAGESGCGKSTLLKLIYGFYDVEIGSIAFDGKPIRGPKYKLIPDEDNIKYLAQDFGLMPFVSVAENIGTYLSNTDKAAKAARIAALLATVEMTEFTHVHAKNLSGGQQQRVALAKVLALEPKLLLLDEPFSQIDTFHKLKLRRNLFQYLKQQKITCLIATHDGTDILGFADTAIILKDGHILRVDDPISLYENPLSIYEASIFGEVNEISRYLLEQYEDKSATLLLYPHQLEMVTFSNLKAQVIKSYFKGNGYVIEAAYDSGKTLFFENIFSLKADSEIFLQKHCPKIIA